MGFQQALSGLNAASSNLDVIGNNVSNANTVGFKSSRAEFADVYASTVLGTTANAIGIGTKVAAVAQQFTQGSISTTSNPFDVAISGNGFFRLSTNGSISYSRNGQFHLDKNGYLVNAQNQNVTGYPADPNGKILTAQPVPLQMTVMTIPAQATSKVTQGVTLDSRADAIDPAVTPFSATDSDSYTSSTSMVVYDSLGNPHTEATYYAKRGPNEWDVYTTIDGSAPTMDTDGDGVDDAGPMKLVFDTNGVVDTTASTLTPQISVDAAALGTGAGDLNYTFDISQTTQTGQAFANNVQEQDGFTSGSLTNFSIDDNGMLTANYSNQQTRVQGQLVLAMFNNQQGLVDAGNNNYLETNVSGGPRLGVPGSSNFGSVTSGAVEDSNVDLTAELVNMITAQRVYQANSQTIKTEDTIMNTLVNLR